MRWLLMLIVALGAWADVASDEVVSRARDYDTAARLITEGNFAELDKTIPSLKGLKYPSGRSRLHQFYAGLRGAAKPGQAEAWLEANDESLPARILGIDKEGWRERAERLNRKVGDPYLYVRLLEQPGLLKAERDALLDQALKIDKTYLEAYQAYARPLRGQELAEFAERSIGKNPKLLDGMYAIVYSTFADRFGKDAWLDVFTRERVIGGYRELLKQYDNHGHWMSLFCKATACWDDPVTSSALGKRLNGWRDPDVWEPRQWDGFQQWLKAYKPE